MAWRAPMVVEVGVAERRRICRHVGLVVLV